MIIDFFGDISLSMNCDVEQAIVDAINEELTKSDYIIANLESPIISDIVYSPIVKDGPNLYTTKESVWFYSKLKFGCYTLANNHMGDYGCDAICDTLDALKKINKEYVGTSMKVEDIYLPLRKEIGGIKFSVFFFL